MNRIYFKNGKHSEIRIGFLDFLKKNGARYYDPKEEFGVFVIPKQYGDNRLAISFNKKCHLEIGKIDLECDNFETDVGALYPEEMEWLFNIWEKLKKYKED